MGTGCIAPFANIAVPLFTSPNTHNSAAGLAVGGTGWTLLSWPWNHAWLLLQYVSEVVIGAPYAVTADLLDHFRVSASSSFILGCLCACEVLLAGACLCDAEGGAEWAELRPLLAKAHCGIEKHLGVVELAQHRLICKSLIS